MDRNILVKTYRTLQAISIFKNNKIKKKVDIKVTLNKNSGKIFGITKALYYWFGTPRPPKCLCYVALIADLDLWYNQYKSCP